MAVVVFPDATAVTVGYLNGRLAARGVNDVPVRSKIPNPRPSPFVMIHRVGGPRRDIVTDNARLDVECWGDTAHAAHDLAQLIRALIFDMVGTVSGVPVYKVNEVGGVANLPDPLSDHPRYVFSVEVAMRGTAA